MRDLKGDWRDLLNGFMVALDLRKCFLGLCGIALTVILCGGITIYLGNSMDADKVEVPKDLVLHKWWKSQCQAWHVIYTGTPYIGTTPAATKDVKGRLIDYRNVAEYLQKGGHWYVYVPYTIVFVLTFVGIWSYFGGAISRIAAYEIAKDGERIETRKALQFSRKKFWSFFWAPLICAIGFLFFAFCNFAGGLIGKVLDYLYIGAPLVALLLPLAILSGFVMTLIIVGTLAGLPLFAPAVAAEGTDSFDAVSRGFSYVYSRPWHFAGYQLVSWGYGCVCIAFVILFAVGMCHVGIEAGEAGYELFGSWMRRDVGEFGHIANASWALVLSNEHAREGYAWDLWSIATEPHPYGRLQVLANEIVRMDHGGPYMGDLALRQRISGFVVTLWLVVTLGLALGYVASYFISQQTMIYYILRKKVDGIEMNEVFEETEEERPAEPVKPPEPSKPAEPATPSMEGAKPEGSNPLEPPKEGGPA